MHGRTKLLVAFPVAIRFLDHDAALEQQTFEHLVDVELRVFGLTHTECDVFEIAEQGEVAGVGLHGHVYSRWLASHALCTREQALSTGGAINTLPSDHARRAEMIGTCHTT